MVSEVGGEMNSLILLVEPSMLPVPSTLEVVSDFGSEQVVVEDPDTKHVTSFRGNCILLRGKPLDFRTWLADFPQGVWVTTNPMLGNWKRRQV